MTPDTQALVAMHLESMYAVDDRGRLTGIRDGSAEPPPRFALVRSAAGAVWRVGARVPDDTAAALAALAGREPGGTARLPAADRAYREILGRDEPVHEVLAGPAYVLPEDLPDPGASIELGPEHRDLLVAHFPVTAETFEQRTPVVGIVADGAVVARCCAARDPSEGVEASLDTAEPYRRCGYGMQVAAGWARAVRRSGRVPLYSTEWANVASQAVAARLGAVWYAVDYDVS